MAEKLKDCPFCGSDIVLKRDGAVRCSSCSAHTDPDFGTWNRRTPGPATKAMIEDVERTLREIGERDLEFDPSNHGNPWISTLQAFLAEWKGE